MVRLEIESVGIVKHNGRYKNKPKFERRTTMNKLKAFAKKHKKALIFTGVVGFTTALAVHVHYCKKLGANPLTGKTWWSDQIRWVDAAPKHKTLEDILAFINENVDSGAMYAIVRREGPAYETMYQLLTPMIKL